MIYYLMNEIMSLAAALFLCPGTVIRDRQNAMGSTLAVYHCPGTIFCTGAGGG